MSDQRNIKLIVAYHGTAYHGWQRQAEGFISVQQLLEEAAGRIVGHPVTVYGAGRTDAGVHAEGQGANFRTTNAAIPLSGLRRALNSALPHDIAVRSATEAAPDFHASRSAVGKTYRYRIWTAPQRPVALADMVWHYWRPLEIEPMRLAARRLLGTHDFRGFASSAEIREDTVRTIRRCEVSEDGGEVRVVCQGDGFLYHMVRNIVGTLVAVGRGQMAPERIDKVLASRDRRDAGQTAPPQGLCLVCVHYE